MYILRSYFYRFGLIDNPMFPCEEEEEQTTDPLIFIFNKLSKQRKMIKQIQNTGGSWPPTHGTLVNDYIQLFVKFIKTIDSADLK